MKSQDYFDAFRHALDNAQNSAASSLSQSGDLDVFLRAKEILFVCYDGNAKPELRNLVQRRACEILLDVSDPDDWDGGLDVYGAAWRLSNVLPDDEEGRPSAPEADVCKQTLTQDLLLMARELEEQVDQLGSDIAAQPGPQGGTDAHLGELQAQLGLLRCALCQIKDVAASGASFTDYFSAGDVGVRFIDRISDPFVALLLGIRELDLSPQARDLVENVATGVTDLAHRIAGAAAGNSAVSECVENFEKRIKSHLVAEAPAGKHGAFRDGAETWLPEMVEIPPGDFLMGSNDPEHQDEIPQHPVKIGYKFAVGRYPVTFEEYGAYCRATARALPKDNGWGFERRPVINVSWDDAQSYVDWLSEETGEVYRLLTEAEWEYACRAGSTTTYSFGDDARDLDAHGWYVGNLDGETRPVGQGLPNEFGLYDMHGNVWEWIEDVWHDSYAGTPPDNGKAWVEGGNPLNRLLRGGSWVSLAKGLRSSVRFTGATDYVKNNVGFRVARTL